MKDKTDDPNALLILRESSERKALKGNFSPTPSRGSKDEPERGRFETLSVKPIEDKRYTMRAPSAAQNQDTTRAQEEKAKQEAAQKERKIQEEEQNMRNQAQDLRNQIDWWKSQRDQGTHDESTINGQVSYLEGQLNGIPSKFWY